jgi:hypothetical protein
MLYDTKRNTDGVLRERAVRLCREKYDLLSDAISKTMVRKHKMDEY